MTMTLQEISDRLELQQLTADYCHIIDQKQIDQLDNIFTADAFIDYTAMGGIKGNLEEIKGFLKSVLPLFSASQHMISNYQFQIDGDKATGRIMCFNPMQPAEAQTFFLGLWYIDEYVRTDNGWRISRREEEKSYSYNQPKQGD